MRKVTKDRARIILDINYGSGGYFSFVPCVEKPISEYDPAFLKEATGFYWMALYQDSILKSKELFYAKATEQEEVLENLYRTVYGYQFSTGVDGNDGSGYCRRAFKTNNEYSNANCIFRISEEPEVDGGFVFDVRKTLSMEVYPFSYSSGYSQYYYPKITGTLLSESNDTISLIECCGYSGQISGAPTFFYDRFQKEVSGHGAFLFPSLPLMEDFYSSFPSASTGIILVRDPGELPSVYYLNAFYVKTNFFNAKLYPLISTTGRICHEYSKSTGYLEIFSQRGIQYDYLNYDNYYEINEDDFFEENIICEKTVEQLPFLEYRHTEFFTGNNGIEISKATGENYSDVISATKQVYQYVNRSQNNTGVLDSFQDVNNIQNGHPAQTKGFLKEDNPLFLQSDLTVSGTGQLIYRDYYYKPGSYAKYSSLSYKIEAEITGKSPDSYDEILLVNKAEQTGYMFVTKYKPINEFNLVENGTVDLDSNTDDSYIAAIHFSSDMPFNTLEIIANPVNINVDRLVQDCLVFSPMLKFQTGKTSITITQSGDSFFDKKTETFNINWIDSSLAYPTGS